MKNKFAYTGKITYDYSAEIGNYNMNIVLTNERKKHILGRHPEMKNYIPFLIDYVNNPNEYRLDKGNRDTLNVIRNLDKKYQIFITVKFAKKEDEKNSSIISARYQYIRKNKKG